MSTEQNKARDPHTHPTIPIKKHYLSLGDSNALGVGDPSPVPPWNGGYVPRLFERLKRYGAEDYCNLAQGSETTDSFIGKGHQYNQLDAAVAYLTHKDNVGEVSPVTLSIGGNDVTFALKQCHSIGELFDQRLKNAKKNLNETILPKLKEALTVNDSVTGSIVMVNYWDPYVRICGDNETLKYVHDLNDMLREAVSGVGGLIADIFTPFGGDSVPNPKLCEYTWLCDPSASALGVLALHANPTGYQVIADAFAEVMGIK